MAEKGLFQVQLSSGDLAVKNLLLLYKLLCAVAEVPTIGKNTELISYFYHLIVKYQDFCQVRAFNMAQVHCSAIDI